MTPVSGEIMTAAVAQPAFSGSGTGRQWERLYQDQLVYRQHSRGASEGRRRSGSGSDERRADRKLPDVGDAAGIPTGGRSVQTRQEAASWTVATALTDVDVASFGLRPRNVSLAPAYATPGEMLAILERSGLTDGYRTFANAAPQSDGVQSSPEELMSREDVPLPSVGEMVAHRIALADAFALAGVASVTMAAAAGVHQPTGRESFRSVEPADGAPAAASSRAQIAACVSGLAATQERRQDAGSRQEHSADARRGESATGEIEGRHFGTVPLIVSDQLLELEFVALGRGEGSGGSGIVQHVQVTFQAPGSGRVGLSAHYRGRKVTVELEKGEVTDPPAAGGGVDIRGLLQRLGWGSLPVEITGDAGIQNRIGAMP